MTGRNGLLDTPESLLLGMLSAAEIQSQPGEIPTLKLAAAYLVSSPIQPRGGWLRKRDLKG
jgi:hypothetical protein